MVNTANCPACGSSIVVAGVPGDRVTCRNCNSLLEVGPAAAEVSRAWAYTTMFLVGMLAGWVSVATIGVKLVMRK